MVNMKERHLLVLFPQHEANGFDELDAFENIAEVQQLDMAEVFEARHMTLPDKVKLVAGSEDVD